MPDFYYQIKAKDESQESWSNWLWPPVFSGKISAEDKRSAKVKIEDEYCRKFPMRVLKKDIEKHNFLIRLTEIEDGNDRICGLFELRECQQCKNKFRVIDKYNDPNEMDKGWDFCTSSCRSQYKAEHTIDRFSETHGSHQPVIYKIINQKTGKSYVGQTTQPFTLRWYQHFFQGTGTKFHEAIESSSLMDWSFSILEVVKASDGVDISDALSSREAYWIDKLDTIENGYNTAKVVSRI